MVVNDWMNVSLFIFLFGRMQIDDKGAVFKLVVFPVYIADYVKHHLK